LPVIYAFKLIKTLLDLQKRLFLLSCMVNDVLLLWLCLVFVILGIGIECRFRWMRWSEVFKR
jgi:hypothetical protein